jgi:hypothetical protein
MALGMPGVAIVTAFILVGAVVLRWSNSASVPRTYARARAEVMQRHGGPTGSTVKAGSRV